MKTTVIFCDKSNALSTAKCALKQSGIIAFPTDTVYGIGALYDNPTAIKRLYKVKQRDLSKAIAILVSDMQQLSQVVLQLTEAAHRLARRFWPGALTIVLEKHPSLPKNLSPFKTIGVRMPDHPFALALISQTGPLATTSANISGGPNPTTAEEVLAQLKDRIELVLDGGKTRNVQASTVVDCSGPDIKILRQGCISEEDILLTLQYHD